MARFRKPLYDWIVQKRKKEKPVTTMTTVEKMRKLKRDKTENSLRLWLGKFIVRKMLAVRKLTHIGSRLPENYILKIAEFWEFLESIISSKNITPDIDFSFLYKKVTV